MRKLFSDWGQGPGLAALRPLALAKAIRRQMDIRLAMLVVMVSK